MIASTRRQLAPMPDGRPHPPMLLSVDLDDGEEIEWIWIHPQEGPSYVSGYRRVPRLPRDWQPLQEARNA